MKGRKLSRFAQDITPEAAVSITNDGSACHNLLTMDDPNPKLLTDLGMR
jgi:hypothetical protein